MLARSHTSSHWIRRKSSDVVVDPESPATGRAESFVSLEQGGKVASHLAKYSHHPSGLALFSQTGKIRSEVRRQSVPLDTHEGHLFTVLINGLHVFNRASGRRDEPQITPQRAVLTFELPPDSAEYGTLKIVGRWADVTRLRFSTPTDTAGPFIPTIHPTGDQRFAAALANPAVGTHHVLLLTCAVIPRLGTSGEMLMFFGGFDARDVMDDTSKEAGFLAFTYPASDAAELRQRLGSVDLQ